MGEPSTQLAISLLDSRGTVAARWGPDEAAVGDVPKGLSFSTSDPGGFKDAGLSLSRRIDRAWPDLQLLRDMRIYGAGNRTAWEGRLQDIPLHYAEEHSINPGAVGHAAALDDDPTFREYYVGRDLNEWKDLAAQRRINYGVSFTYAGFGVAPDSAEGRPALTLEIGGTWGSQKPLAGSMLDAGAGCKIAAVDYDFVLSTADGGFEFYMNLSDVDAGPALENQPDMATGATTGAGTWTPVTARRVLCAFWVYSSFPAGVDGAQYRAYLRRLAWFGNHGLTIRGERPRRGVYASDVIANVVQRCAPGLNFTTGPGGSIEPSDHVIPH
ncbi:MAG TPA: hypothetical protein VG458_07795, partial [Solirubrobacterales bacterium]|nr:hypothetical protein [Solirubrobacterales bacterium]